MNSEGCRIDEAVPIAISLAYPSKFREKVIIRHILTPPSPAFVSEPGGGGGGGGGGGEKSPTLFLGV